MRARAWVALLVAGLAGPGWAVGPLEVDHPLVAQGRAAYEAGQYEQALESFEAARKERPDDPAVEYNRGVALAQLGRVAEAKSSFQRVIDSNRPELRQKAWYNMGNVHATMGERKEALQAYRRALSLDPNDELSRHNYEVVLRNLPPPQQGAGADGGTDGGSDGGGSDGGRPDGGQDGGQRADGGTPVDGGVDDGDAGSDAGAIGDAGSDGGMDGGGGDGGADGGQQGEGQGDGGSDGGSDAGSGEGEGEGSDGGADGGTGEEQMEDVVDAGVRPEDIDRQEAERLLDAMKQNEKNLQLWRFQQKKQRKPNEKDW